MKLIEKKEMKRLPGMFSCVVSCTNSKQASSLYSWLTANKMLVEHDSELLRFVCSDSELTFILLNNSD